VDLSEHGADLGTEGGVQWRGLRLDDGDIRTEGPGGRCGLQPDPPTTDDHDLRAREKPISQVLRVLDGAERMEELATGNRQVTCHGSRG